VDLSGLRDKKVTDNILAQLEDIFSKHSNAGVLEECARALVALANDKSPAHTKAVCNHLFFLVLTRRKTLWSPLLIS
jgi:hypothetical protein